METICESTRVRYPSWGSFLAAFLKKPEQILAISDLYLQASEHESFGLSILEAMSCGVPAVATEVGGVPELVEHGVSGLLSQVGDFETLADNAIKILKEESIHDLYKKKALLRSAQFDISNILPQFYSTQPHPK